MTSSPIFNIICRQRVLKNSINLKTYSKLFSTGATKLTSSSNNTETTTTSTNPSLNFYYSPSSPPCRSIMLTAKSLGLKLNYKPISLHDGDNLKPEFLKLNPLSQIPVLDDNGFIMVESRAIIQYLVNAYGQDENGDTLYPKDPQKRYLVDRMLNFDMGTLYSSFSNVYYPVIEKEEKLDEIKMKKFKKNLCHLEDYLFEAQTLYVAGNEITIADFAVMASLSSIETVYDDIHKFRLIPAYMQRCCWTMVGYKEVSQKGLDKFATWAKSGLQNSAK